MKKCSRCKIEKEDNEFYNCKVHSWCKSCRREVDIIYRSNNKEKIRENSKSYRYKTKYNLSKEEIELKLSEQNNHCLICKKNFNDIIKNTGKKGTLALCVGFKIDHNHKTEKIRGLLCDKCNRGLGFFNDSTELLQDAIKYLEEE